LNKQVTGIQLTGRHAWPDEQTSAARAYARESNPEKLAAFASEQKRSAESLARLQVELDFSYVTDGGFALQDDFVPYIKGVPGVTGAEGKINQQPGTRNQYYFIPMITEKLSAPYSLLEEYLMPDVIPGTAKKKLTLLSPLSFALAAELSPETPAYSDRIALLNDFATIQGWAIHAIASNYDYIQLNESFATDERFSGMVTKDMLSAFRDSLNKIFEGLPVRSSIYFSSGDATALIPAALESKVTDIGFDFNTPASSVLQTIDKNLILGLQNVAGKLPEDLLKEEPQRLAERTKEVLSTIDIRNGAEIFLAQSQGSDGLQTYPQALRRDTNISKAFELIRSE
jgi:methionine synthase II (cobalamin-independent)